MAETGRTAGGGKRGGAGGTSRLLMLGALVVFAGVFLFPLWSITLNAPQFPGGLRLEIWINKMSGDSSSGDIIQNINILNHYIGMKPIRPDSIPELRYFPYIAWAMIGLGLLVVLLNRRGGYLAWVVLLAVLGTLGLYDFQKWMHDYGHDLDPKAPIQVPGMSYSPPLIGEKDLLNFHVASYPDIGGFAMGGAMLLAALAFWFRRGPGRRGAPKAALVLFSALGGAIVACASPEPAIAWGEDQCAYCRMTISDPHFGAVLVTEKGRQLKYDAAECLAGHLDDGAPPARSLHAVAYNDPGRLHPIESVRFVFSERYRSPMGADLAALLPVDSLDTGDAPPLDWPGVRTRLAGAP